MRRVILQTSEESEFRASVTGEVKVKVSVTAEVEVLMSDIVSGFPESLAEPRLKPSFAFSLNKLLRFALAFQAGEADWAGAGCDSLDADRVKGLAMTSDI